MAHIHSAAGIVGRLRAEALDRYLFFYVSAAMWTSWPLLWAVSLWHRWFAPHGSAEEISQACGLKIDQAVSQNQEARMTLLLLPPSRSAPEKGRKYKERERGERVGKSTTLFCIWVAEPMLTHAGNQWVGYILSSEYTEAYFQNLISFFG